MIIELPNFDPVALSFSFIKIRWYSIAYIFGIIFTFLFLKFHNKKTNLGLAQQNLVDHFWGDLYDLPDGADARPLVTYAMMERLVEIKLMEIYGPHTHRQFELRMVLDGVEGTLDDYTMIQSPVIECH